MSTNPHIKDLNSSLHRLPTKLMQEILEADTIVDILEDMIEMALSYISRYPPEETLSSALTDSRLALVAAKAPTVAMFQTSPDWVKVASAPTDYAVLQNARAMRLSELKDWASSHRMSSANAYPRAQAAIGNKRSEKANRSPMLVALGIMFLMAAMLLLSCGNVVAPKLALPVETLMVKTALPPRSMTHTTGPAVHYQSIKFNSFAKSVRNETPSEVAILPGRLPYSHSTAISVVVAATTSTNPVHVKPTPYLHSSAISAVALATKRADPALVEPAVPKVVIAHRPAFSTFVAPYLYSNANSVVAAATTSTNPVIVEPTPHLHCSAISAVVAAKKCASPVLVKPTVSELVIARMPAFSALVAPVPQAVAKSKAFPFLDMLRRKIAKAVKGFFARFRRTQRDRS